MTRVASPESVSLFRLESLCQLVCDDPSMPDELLFGRVGYIYALLFVQQHLGEGKIDNSLVLKVNLYVNSLHCCLYITDWKIKVKPSLVDVIHKPWGSNSENVRKVVQAGWSIWLCNCLESFVLVLKLIKLTPNQHLSYAIVSKSKKKKNNKCIK